MSSGSDRFNFEEQPAGGGGGTVIPPGTGYIKQGPPGTFASGSIANGDLPGSGQINVSVSTPASGGGLVSLGGTVNLGVSLGTTGSTAAAGNDVRFNATPAAAGGVSYDSGTGWLKSNIGTATQVLHGGSAPGFSAMLASETNYSPSAPGDWPIVVSTAAQGLDNLASRLITLSGYPYTPAVPSNWLTSPATLSAGLDSLADRTANYIEKGVLVTDEDFLSFATTGTSLLGSTVTWQTSTSGAGTNISAALAAEITPDTTGAIVIPTGTTAGGRSGIILGSSASAGSVKMSDGLIGATFDIEWTWRFTTLFSIAEQGWFMAGLTSNISLGSAGPYGLFWRYDGGVTGTQTLSAIIRANNLETGSALSVVPVTANTIYRTRVTSDGNNVTWRLTTGRSGGSYTTYLTIPMATIIADVGWQTNLLGAAARVQKALGVTSIRPIVDRAKLVFKTF